MTWTNFDIKAKQTKENIHMQRFFKWKELQFFKYFRLRSDEKLDFKIVVYVSIYLYHHRGSEFQVILWPQFFILIETVTSWKCSTHQRLILPSHGNQSNGFQGRSVTWFLYYWNIDLERINIDGKHGINSLANFQMWWLVKGLLKRKVILQKVILKDFFKLNANMQLATVWLVFFFGTQLCFRVIEVTCYIKKYCSSNSN